MTIHYITPIVERKPSKRPDKIPSIHPKLIEFDQIATRSGAYNASDPRRQTLINRYLTSDVTLAELTQIAQVKTLQRVRSLITSSLSTVPQHLPSEIKEQYPSPQKVLALKTHTRTKSTCDKISNALTGRTRTELTEEKRGNIGSAAQRH